MRSYRARDLGELSPQDHAWGRTPV